MDDKTNAQIPGKRLIVERLDREFARLHSSCCRIIETTTNELLYAAPASLGGLQSISIGERVLRSAAAIERTFGGITSNLWDDPFEWTLPEHLSNPARVIEHLREVEALRCRAFSSFTDDSCLKKYVATPAEETSLLIELLLETLVGAAEYQGQAAALKKTFQ